jgi:O-antigen ligase
VTSHGNMAVAAVKAATITGLARVRENIAFFGLLGALTAYSLTTLDGGDVAQRIISSLVFLLCALYLVLPIRQCLTVNVPIVCLLLMSCYGAAQTLWAPQKLAYSGWTDVLFWFTAAAICLLSSQVFRDPRTAARFRLSFVLFASAVCLLDLLEQASHTNKYFWLIQSRYATINGPFGYWNNLAQFAELCLPITLSLGVASRKHGVPFLILSGLQIAAVIASGSRAGSALIITEFVAVMAIAYFRHRERAYMYAAAVALLVSVLFTYAAGFGALSDKLQRRDQMAVRREINVSSLEMIRERPFSGWGLGTYVPVYRMFAHHDDGTYVNRAHNDWLEWTAEGGLLFSGLMAVMFGWSIRPAIRSVWGIGLIALCLHAVVDYPFARFGVCGWYFALLGMLAAAPQGNSGSAGELARHLCETPSRGGL